MKLLAPAKLNLGLRIVGRRPDGYHLLESLFWPISLQDEISLRPTDGTFSVSMKWAPGSPFAADLFPAECDNLVSKALRHPLIDRHYIVDIIKRIPLGGGLGGGSSDVGTFLGYAQNQGYLTPRQASELALELGADVPFFLAPGPAWVSGIGDKIQRLTLTDAFPQLPVMLIFPPSGAATAEVFRRYRSSKAPYSPSASFPEKISSIEMLKDLLSAAGNDLENAAIETLPLIGKILETLRKQKTIYAGMSGSGSTCFAIFESEHHQTESAKVLLPIFRSLHCRSLFVETL